MRVLLAVLLVVWISGWSTESEAAEPLTLKGHLSRVTSVSFSTDGKRIVSGSRDGTVKVWDISSLDTSQSPSSALPPTRRRGRGSDPTG